MTLAGMTSLTIQSALRGLDARRQAHEANVANVETPGYKARSVEFEAELKAALTHPRLVTRVTPNVNVSGEAGRANGNNVNIDQEMVSLTETALTQELLIRALNDRYGLLRTAAGNG